MAFYVRRRLSELNTRQFVIGNSQTITVGDAVIPTQTTSDSAVNVITSANTTVSILGVVVSIIQAGHVAEITTVAAASNNLTIANPYLAEVELVQNISEVEATLDATSGTTTGSYLPGYFKVGTGTGAGTTPPFTSAANVGAGLLHEASYVVSGTAGSSADGLQFFSMGNVTGGLTVRGWFTNQ